jgi:hypothetical protein
MERRELIRFLMATAGLKCLDGFHPDELLAFGLHVHESRTVGRESPSVLDAHARRTVVSAAERIIPGGDAPGGARACHYAVDAMKRGDL